MGGHGHGHEPPYKIPSPDIYKVEDVPQLKRVQEKLAAKGLKDPWLRNNVWRYKTTKTPFNLPKPLIIFTRGWRIGVPAFLITIAIESYYGIDYKGHHDADHH